MDSSNCLYDYGMRLRGCSPGAQPKEGFVFFRDDRTGQYWNIITYDRKLTEDEIRNYDLDFLGPTENVMEIR